MLMGKNWAIALFLIKKRLMKIYIKTLTMYKGIMSEYNVYIDNIQYFLWRL